MVEVHEVLADAHAAAGYAERLVTIPRPQNRAVIEPKRVMFFGKNMARSRCTAGLVDSLRSFGLDVKWMNMATLRRWIGRRRAGDWARRAWREYKPDFVFVFCRDLPLPLLEDFRGSTPVVLWIEEPLDDLDAAMADYMARADLVCLSNPGHCDWLAQHGVRNMIFLMSGFSPRFHYPEPKRQPRRDIVFIGGPGRNGQRAQFLAEISREFDVEIYGFGWEDYLGRYRNLRVRRPVKTAGFRSLCATSRIVLGLNQVNVDPLYFSNRTFLTLACRAFHLTHYVPGLESVFTNRHHLAWYRNADECKGMIREYLAADHERERIAQAGYDLVLEQHQYRHRVADVLAALREGVPANNPARTCLQRVRTEELPVHGHVNGSSVSQGARKR